MIPAAVRIEDVKTAGEKHVLMVAWRSLRNKSLRSRRGEGDRQAGNLIAETDAVVLTVL